MLHTVDHAEALREMSVEKYLLGELRGGARDAFEEHLFECSLCAADLKSSVTFAEAAQEELAKPQWNRVAAREKSAGWLDRLLRPQWMAPALAACLLLAGYQSLFTVPALRQQLAQEQSPRVLNSFTLASGAMRGVEVKKVTAPANGAFLLSVDLLPAAGVTSYQCTLYSPSGAKVWQGAAPVSPGAESIEISVPTASTGAGRNRLALQAVGPGGSSGGTLGSPTDYEFELEVEK